MGTLGDIASDHNLGITAGIGGILIGRAKVGGGFSMSTALGMVALNRSESW